MERAINDFKLKMIQTKHNHYYISLETNHVTKIFESPKQQVSLSKSNPSNKKISFLDYKF